MSKKKDFYEIPRYSTQALTFSAIRCYADLAEVATEAGWRLGSLDDYFGIYRICRRYRFDKLYTRFGVEESNTELLFTSCSSGIAGPSLLTFDPPADGPHGSCREGTHRELTKQPAENRGLFSFAGVVG
ncbi:MAG: hypothetical protein RLZZ458_2134 [Planctomycetota bacterium]|jgi:hypothetical protein